MNQFQEILIITFLLALGIQLIYWLIFSLLIFKKRSDLSPNQTLPGISVVICAWNEEDNLRELIPQVLNQDYPHFELVIVDDRSSDGSYDYLIEQKLMTNKIRHVRVDEVPNHMDSKKFAIIFQFLFF